MSTIILRVNSRLQAFDSNFLRNASCKIYYFRKWLISSPWYGKNIILNVNLPDNLFNADISISWQTGDLYSDHLPCTGNLIAACMCCYICSE